MEVQRVELTSTSDDEACSVYGPEASNIGAGLEASVGDWRRLTSDLADCTLLRGVPCGTALGSFGAAFKTRTGSICVNSTDHEKSIEVANVDDFISHSWASGRWAKALTLLIHYNGGAAFGISMIACAMVAVVQLDIVGLIPRPCLTELLHTSNSYTVRSGVACSIVGPIVFLAVLIYWQDAKSLLSTGHRMLFLDKYCVDQVDFGRQQAAILGIAGFLRHSDQLLVCWTPSYLTRLWCTYEVASWRQLGKQIGSVKIKTVPQTLVICTCVCAQLISEVVLVVIHAFVDLEAIGVLRGALLTLLCIAPIEMALRTTSHQRNIMQKQLFDFSITQTTCFCC